MSRLELCRTFESKTTGTAGVLKIDGRPFCYTLELGYRNNEANISSIPLGQYKVMRHNSPKFGACLLVLNVQGRSDILFHAGNRISDTQGCILVGDKLEDKGGVKILYDSKVALDKLLKKVANEKEILLTVSEI